MNAIYALDLETCTNPGDGLDPTNPLTRITSAAIFFGPAKGVDGPEGSVVFDDPDEARLLRSLNAWFCDESTEPGLIVTWNGANFDIPFLLTRSAFLGVELDLQAQLSELRAPKYGPCRGHAGGYVANWGPHDHADVWPSFIEIANRAGIKTGLKPVANYFGYNPIVVDRQQMESLTVPERCAYNISDVEVTYRLALLADDLDARRDSRVHVEASLLV